MKLRMIRHLALAFLLMNSCTSERIGPDRDGDGLSDAQEILFGTNPDDPDTDGDTIPDALDPSPADPVRLSFNVRVGEQQIQGERAQIELMIWLVDSNGRWITGEEIGAATTFGELGNRVDFGTGMCQIVLSAEQNGTAVVTFQTMTNGVPDGRASESVQIKLTLPNHEIIDPPDPPDPPAQILESDMKLVQPGINPQDFANAGPMNGELWVMAIDGNSLDWSEDALKPWPNAFVQIDLADGSHLTGRTNEKGWIHFTDSRLKDKVNVTVGAEKSRYTTWMDVDARVISAGIYRRDITQEEENTEGAVISGVVRGFWGETGLDSFPTENTNVFGTINMAIVQVGIRNTPLSSMNTGSILLPPDSSTPTAAYFEIPPNLALANLSNPDSARFSLNRLKPGKYVVFALAGAGSNIMQASQNPYKMKFSPMALGISEIEVKAGQKAEIDIPLTVDLRNGDFPRADVHFGQFPDDPKTGEALPMGLLLPLINTGKGYIFLDVNSAYNFEDFKSPVAAVYPNASHPAFSSLALDSHPMAVGLAARRAISGFDQPGISTLIQHPASNDAGNLENIYMNNNRMWPGLPTFILPAPPDSTAFDAVGGSLGASRKIAWHVPGDADMTILRLNYMTPPVHNVILDSDIGASQAHLLWEVFVPAPNAEIVLPTLDESAPDYPVLRNYAPTVPGDAYQYDENTVELEINAYYMGPEKFDYQSNFLIDDVNMKAWAVSQDSYLIRAE